MGGEAGEESASEARTGRFEVIWTKRRLPAVSTLRVAGTPPQLPGSGLSAFGPRAAWGEHRLASWRTGWRSSAHAGVLAHRLASSAAEKRGGFRVQQVVPNPS